MADIKVNKDQWDTLSLSEQEAIYKGLRESGGLKIGDKIVGDSSVLPFDKNSKLEPMGNPITTPICKAVCDAAAASAAAWCTANTVGVGLAVCIAAAEAAREECKKRC